MQFHVEAWSPSFGASRDAPEPGEPSTAKPETELERPDKDWQPIDPPAGVQAPQRVLLVDGVRRTDARLWIGEHPGLACSYAAGVVECLPGRAHVVQTQVQRVICTPAPAEELSDVGNPPARYRAVPTHATDEAGLANVVQGLLINLEVTVSDDTTRTEDDLLIVDGPLRSPAAQARTLGYIKTQQKRYLPERLAGVATSLKPGQRTPVFGISRPHQQQRLTWYLRLPGGGSAPWGGMVRIECSEPDEKAAIRLADLSTVTLPRFASMSYKDPRAPQNLVPIAGLEKRLRQLLGDSRLLHRTLVRASVGAIPGS